MTFFAPVFNLRLFAYFCQVFPSQLLISGNMVAKLKKTWWRHCFTVIGGAATVAIVRLVVPFLRSPVPFAIARERSSKSTTELSTRTENHCEDQAPPSRIHHATSLRVAAHRDPLSYASSPPLTACSSPLRPSPLLLLLFLSPSIKGTQAQHKHATTTQPIPVPPPSLQRLKLPPPLMTQGRATIYQIWSPPTYFSPMLVSGWHKEAITPPSSWICGRAVEFH